MLNLSWNLAKAYVMHFRFLTLFPSLITPYFEKSILNIALRKKIFTIQTLDLHDFSNNTHDRVDNSQIGGGAGQILNFHTLQNALEPIKNTTHVIFVTPCGKPFKYTDSKRLSKLSDITFVCGRYGGFDERSIEVYANEVLSLGDFILTGGELAALCFCDSISRHLDGVLGNKNSLEKESFENNLLESPVFSKSKSFLKKDHELLAPLKYYRGNHSIMLRLKKDLAIAKTKYFRPDLFQRYKAKSKYKGDKE